MLQQCETAREESVAGTPWQAYPRPQMKRDAWINLNGVWEFAVAGEALPRSYDRTIRVPFCPESALSGIGTHFPEGSALCYRRYFTLPGDYRRGRVLLHVGAADQTAEVFVNGRLLGRHEGGYEAFSVDITDALARRNELVIRCRDDLRDRSFPYGKQTLRRGGMWYTPVSGIWQTVWLEPVPQVYIPRLNIENRGGSVTIDTGDASLSGAVTVAGLGRFPLEKGAVTITPEEPRFWSPEDPFLYEFTLEAGEDRVASYFALRTLEIRQAGGHARLCLNGKPYFFHGLLDQGYWSDGLFTPADPACYARDILAVKKLGFNTLRKHIKVEPEEFYYQCDKLGMVVFQDMVNNGRYRYIRDTVLPTLGFQKLPGRFRRRDTRAGARFLAGMEAAVKQLRSHPCILYWTVFNEGWGQFDSDGVYRRLRDLDDTRWIDTTSGWFAGRQSDVDSRHVYFRRVRLRGGEKPLVLSEFGGRACKVAGHVFRPDKPYGYGGCDTLRALGEEVERLYREEILPCAAEGLCAAVYTQVSDVEDEVNGLLTYDRQVEKLTPERMLPLAEALQRAVRE